MVYRACTEVPTADLLDSLPPLKNSFTNAAMLQVRNHTLEFQISTTTMAENLSPILEKSRAVVGILATLAGKWVRSALHLRSFGGAQVD
ncbi:hypothetical protein PISMIDRAFT_213413 [Pisolithus microcarpus 441]|uniref:Unplaced genomic scaffold scaffold_137, whole genome shotgun sequence n=1 Tax=Pisolithus microcarpus 441 TaxID=765257 RepID=A0A0C9XYZ0_9AGAM|nr:hypothetical protein PISMIDRAFT_213413 [Pisolithus microcarpus 441]